MNCSDGSLAGTWKRIFRAIALTLGCTTLFTGCASGVGSPLSSFFAPRDPGSVAQESHEIPVNPEYHQSQNTPDGSAVRPASASESAFPTGIITLQDEKTLDQLIANADGTVVLDFYADWCGPCKKLGKVLHGMEPTIKDKGATVIKINVDHYPAIKQRFQVKAMPTLVVFNQGQMVKRQVGAPPKSQLLQWMSM